MIDLRDGGDWSLDLCYAGLVQNGVNVIDIPYKHKHREWWDVLEGRRATDWGLERRTLGFSGRDDRGYRLPGASPIESEGIRRVWLDERMESFQRYREMGLDRTDAKVVVVAGHDRFWNHSPEFVASLYGEKLEAMLLDNWYERYATLPFRSRRIGWSCNFDHYWTRPAAPPEKDIDISFVGYNSHPDRERYISFLRKEFPALKTHLILETRPDSFDQFISKSQYFDIISRSKIALNLRGAADRGKTMRAYEIPYVGSCMLSQEIDDPGMTDDFENWKHCFYFDSEQKLSRLIQYLLNIGVFGDPEGPTIREATAARGRERAEQLSAKNRWRNVLQWLNGI